MKRKEKDTTNHGRSNTICGECNRNIAECPWLNRSEPVPGWDAEPDIVVYYPNTRHKTFHIKSCPLFIVHPKSTIYNQKGEKVRERD